MKVISIRGIKRGIIDLAKLSMILILIQLLVLGMAPMDYRTNLDAPKVSDVSQMERSSGSELANSESSKNELAGISSNRTVSQISTTIRPHAIKLNLTIKQQLMDSEVNLTAAAEAAKDKAITEANKKKSLDEKNTSLSKSSGHKLPGFEIIFALIGIVMASYIMLYRKQ
jgi:hypothetical protein